MNKWYDIKAAAKAGGRAQVHIYGEIGDWGITADQFRRDIEALGDSPLDVRISSPGGSAFDGIAMHTILSRLSDVDTYADSAVASAATLPFMAGKRRVMANGSALFIHNPWNFAAGDADQLRRIADGLEVATEALASIYSKTTGKDREEVKKVMKAETWLGAEEAKADGWATDIGEAVTVQANITPGRYPNTPKAFVRENPAQQQKPKDTMNRIATALAKAGLLASADVAEEAAVGQLEANLKTRADALAKITTERDDAVKAKTDAEAQAKQATDKAAANVGALAKIVAAGAVRAGQITEASKAAWEKQLTENPQAALDLLAGIPAKEPGHPALAVTPGGSTAKPENLTEQCLRANGATK